KPLAHVDVRRQPPYGHNPHVARARQGRRRSRLPLARRRQSLHRRQFGLSNRWLCQSDIHHCLYVSEVSGASRIEVDVIVTTIRSGEIGGRQMHSVEARRRAYLPTIQAFLSRDFTLFILALLLFRLLLLVMLGSFVEEREFTDDVDMLQEIARHPFKLLIGHSRYAQHPPLLGF